MAATFKYMTRAVLMASFLFALFACQNSLAEDVATIASLRCPCDDEPLKVCNQCRMRCGCKRKCLGPKLYGHVREVLTCDINGVGKPSFAPPPGEDQPSPTDDYVFISEGLFWDEMTEEYIEPDLVPDRDPPTGVHDAFCGGACWLNAGECDKKKGRCTFENPEPGTGTSGSCEPTDEERDRCNALPPPPGGTGTFCTPGRVPADSVCCFLGDRENRGIKRKIDPSNDRCCNGVPYTRSQCSCRYDVREKKLKVTACRS